MRDEIVEKTTGTRPKVEKTIKKSKEKVAKLKVGDVIKIVTKTPPDHYRDEGLDIYWEDEQEQYLGRSTKIMGVFDDLESYTLAIDNETFYWHKDWLIY